MFNHVMVGSADLDRSRRFYDAVLGVLGAGAPIHDAIPNGPSRLFYRHAGNTFAVTQPIDGAAPEPGNGQTIGFKCDSLDQVRAFHDAAVAHGGTSIERPPGPRDTHMGTIDLAYVRDPDGNKLCAIHRPR